MTSINQSPSATRRAALFRSSRGQALHIPKAFELPGKEVILHREGGRIIIEPIITKQGLLAVLEGLKPWPESFPDVDAGLLPLDETQRQRVCQSPHAAG